MAAEEFPVRRERGRLSIAIVLAVAVVVVLLLQQWLQIIASAILVPQDGLLLSLMGSGIRWMLVVALPFAVGAWFSLWYVAPVSRVLSLSQVGLRALVAAALGAAGALLCSVLVALTQGFRVPGPFFGNSFPLAYGGWDVLEGVRSAVHTGISVFAQAAPVVALVLLVWWCWPRVGRVSPASSGNMDEV
ncbi:hypothetical protein OH146_02560 [Salinibacterium sp. SYSU T00001]|uniref:hypothetical protein n=1 Tax=Homoserinimonas sedimenticola TaxID=2986805 RepID=UPI0022360AF6|nr:hypothetical protein [Salinibacterium sedimenticola]MCW4384651.1 hypothetical protein [Salinibacterium sedimenticola]